MAGETITPHPDFTRFNSKQLKDHIKDLQDKISLGVDSGIEKEIITWWDQESRLAQAELSRRNGTIPPGQRPEFWPRPLTAKELLTIAPDQTEWLWKDCLPLGGCSVLVAKPKTGKTTFAVNLALAIARGLPLLSREVKQAPVAYLSLDASFPEIIRVFTRFNLQESDPVFVHAGSAPVEAVKWVMEMVQEHSIRFVVIDTLQRLFRFKNINDYSEVTNAMEPLLDGARQSTIHIMFTHHAKKNADDDLDSALGSTAIRGLFYSQLHMKRLRESTQRIFTSDQRGGENFEQIGISNADSGWIESLGTREEIEIQQIQPQIIEALAEQANMSKEGMAEKEIRALAPVRGIITGKAIRTLLKANKIERTGTGKRGDSYKYFLAGKTPPDSGPESSDSGPKTRDTNLLL